MMPTIVVQQSYEEMDNVNCVVCKHGYKNGSSIKFLPKCYHTLHGQCANDWFNLSVSCPKCKRIVRTSDFVYHKALAQSVTENLWNI